MTNYYSKIVTILWAFTLLFFPNFFCGNFPVYAIEGFSAFETAPDLLLQSKNLAQNTKTIKKRNKPSQHRKTPLDPESPTTIINPRPSNEDMPNTLESRPRRKQKTEEDNYGDMFKGVDPSSTPLAESTEPGGEVAIP